VVARDPVGTQCVHPEDAAENDEQQQEAGTVRGPALLLGR
jgi:hypothetical protein